MADTVRRSLVISENEAASWIDDGMTVAVGGLSLSSHPMAMVRQMIRRKRKDLTVVGAITSSLEVDMLVAGGCVRKVISPYVGAEHLGPVGPCFRRAAERGEIHVWECTEGILVQALRARAQLLPFLPWLGGVGTSYPEVNPELKVIKDPFQGRTLLAVPALAVDVALLHSAHADAYGNVQPVGTGYGDRLHHSAAEKTIVQVEKVVSNEEIRRRPELTSIPAAHAIVRAPYGAHPFASPGHYLQDEVFIKQYLKVAQDFANSGQRKDMDAWLDSYVHGPESHVEYLERVGLRQLLSLYEY